MIHGKSAFLMIAAAVLLSSSIASAQTFTLLHSFNGTDGSYPTSGLVQGLNGSLYGLASGGGTNLQGSVYKVTPSGTLSPSSTTSQALPTAPIPTPL